jgi:hypothetical protein
MSTRRRKDKPKRPKARPKQPQQPKRPRHFHFAHCPRVLDWNLATYDD